MTTKNEAIAREIADVIPFELRILNKGRVDKLHTAITAALDQRDREHAEQVKRLREALEKIVSLYPHSSSCNLSVFVKGGDQCNCGTWSTNYVAIARAALGEVGEKV